MEPRTTAAKTPMFASRLLYSITISLTVLLILISVHPSAVTATDDDSVFQYTRGPVPENFQLGQHYPSRSETDECRPIRLRIGRESRLFRTNLVVNANPDIHFANNDAKRMTSRLQSRLNTLASTFYSRYQLHITVHLAWVEYSLDDGVGDPQSLHYEGRTVRVSVQVEYMSELLKVAIEAGFDWVYYANHSYVRLSVIPDVCDVNVDMVFMLDQSGSVGQYNHDIALYFLRDVVSFYNISQNATQVGLVTFSSGARIRFDLDDHSSLSSLLYALSQVRYTGGWTTTALALALTHQILNPSRDYGARPFTQGIPKVAVLITDGRSNLYPIHEIAPLLRSAGVQVYTVGIGNIYLPELQFIASDPDPLHVFLLNSYNDAPAFVDFLSFTTCDTPAIVEPGDNTTTEVEEDGFRFFQSACPAFSVTIMIEQIDLVGSCSLYASNQVQNPGPLSPGHLTVSNEDHHSNRRSVYLSLSGANKFVYVSVRGHAPRNHFSVIIWDMIFGEDLYNVSVFEGISNVDVFDLNAVLRMTNVSFNYTIVAGNEAGFFALDSLTGRLAVVSPLNADIHDYFLLTIVAQNSNYSCHRGRVKIKIIVIRDGIDFPDIQPVPIPENAGIDFPVTQVQALGDGGNISYSIIGGNIGNAFAMNSSSGDITVASQLDFETLASYNLTIRGVSTVTGSSATTTLQINIEDVNEVPFFTDACAQSGNCVFSVSENQSAGILVDTLIGDDPDGPDVPNGMLTFSVVNTGGGFLPFELMQNGRQVEIRTSAVLDHEDRMTYNFIIRVNDQGTPLLFAEVPVIVNVIDINDNAPVFVQPPLLLSISEATSNGTVVETYIATDSDSGQFGTVVYNISSPTDPLPFAINSQSGELFVNGMLDFEQVTLYTVEVMASNPDGQQSTTTRTFISITDENDNPPIFNDTVYFGNVTEHAPGGSAILTVTASDADSGDNGRIVFSIVSGNFFNLLAIDTIGGGLGIIRVAANAEINREVIDLFNLTIRANDLGSPQMEDFAQVVIAVDDINDNAPVFLPSFYRATVREDAGQFTGVQNVFAIDLDQSGTPNSEIDYEITGGNIGNVFVLNQIDNNNAEIQVFGSLDFETQPFYRLIITASDKGTPQLNGTADVLITITDVNIEPPIVTGNQTVSISELTPVGTQIAKINATDFGNPQLMFIISSVTADGVNGNDALGMFSIDGQGVIRLEVLLNFEQDLSYEIEITVTDGMLSSTIIIFIEVMNENEFAPVFNGSQPLNVREELPAGTPVGTVVATDADRNSSISYSIVMDSPSSSLFAIDSQTGSITTTQVLDREELVQRDLFLPLDGSSTTIRVQAVDDRVPSRFSMTEVMIMLKDINDNAPMFDMIIDGVQAPIVEERSAESLVVNALARDLDLGVNGEVNYTLKVLNLAPGSMPPFEIDPQSGVVTITRPLDRETVESYVIFIRAFDRGDPSLSTNATVNVTVSDVNDNAPIFFLPVYEISIFENAAFPMQLLQVQADDADLGSNAVILYSIQEAIPANSSSLFSVSPNNGTISLIGMLDFESRALHRLIVAADDGINCNTTEVIISVINVDETPPQFFRICTIPIPEDLPPGTAITQCTARDFDDSVNRFRAADRYELVSGNINDTFRIADDGTVFLERNVDRETIPFYSIVVRAFDLVGLSNTTQLLVTIDDINDNPPIFQNIPETRVITQTEIQSQETNFFTLEATDADAGANANIVYSLISNELNDTVTELTITASDQGSPMMSTTALLTYQFEVPCNNMLQEHSINESSGKVTSELLCEVNIQPPSNNLILGQDLQLMCNVLRNVDATFEFLHNGSRVTSAIPLSPSEAAGVFFINGSTFQDAGEYACKVMAPGVGTLQSNNAVVRVQVLPVITIPPEDEAREVGSSITFRCFASGVPQPTFTWRRQTAQGTEVLTTRPRILVTLNFLVISGIVSDDQGTYTCSASNSAGSVEASATLTVFSQSNVIVMDIQRFSSPSQDGSCHHFNTSKFEAAMSTITGVATMATNTNGSALCNESACSPSPCQNGGECSLQTEAPGGYICSCSVGYAGVNCETDIDECLDDPCQFGGNCTNTVGSFVCECPSGFRGHRCQYTDVCEGAQDRCPDNQTCVETISNTQGFVCVDATPTGAVVVTGITSGPGHLDDQVNNIQEMASTQVTRKRRQADNVLNNNGFVTNCEARFMPSQSIDGFVLVWACPEGVGSPTQEELDGICRALFSMQLVSSCSTPSGLVLSSLADTTALSNTTVDVFFIMVDEDGAALSGAEALAALGSSDVLARLRGFGYQATGYAAVVPPSQGADKSVSSAAMIAGVLVALSMAVLLSVMIFTVVCIVKQRHYKEKGYPPSSNSIHSIYQHTPSSSLRRHADHQSHASQENLIEENPYATITDSMTKKVTAEDTPSDHTHINVQNLFDDDIYGKGYIPPPVVLSPESSRTSSPFQRPPSYKEIDDDSAAAAIGAKELNKTTKRNSIGRLAGGLVKIPSLRRRTESKDNLLEKDSNDDDDDHDYDDVIVNVPALIIAQQDDSDAGMSTNPLPGSETPPRVSSESDQSRTRYRDNEIYCNLPYTKEGGMGNAGERWESYWKTQTLLRSPDQGQRSAVETWETKNTTSKRK